jgi:hypothetical protein
LGSSVAGSGGLWSIALCCACCRRLVSVSLRHFCRAKDAQGWFAKAGARASSADHPPSASASTAMGTDAPNSQHPQVAAESSGANGTGEAHCGGRPSTATPALFYGAAAAVMDLVIRGALAAVSATGLAAAARRVQPNVACEPLPESSGGHDAAACEVPDAPAAGPTPASHPAASHIPLDESTDSSLPPQLQHGAAAAAASDLGTDSSSPRDSSLDNPSLLPILTAVATVAAPPTLSLRQRMSMCVARLQSRCS